MSLFRKKRFPSIESSRLLLRKPSIKDASSYHHILSCPEISRYSDLPYKPTAKRSKRFVRWMSTLDNRGTGAAWLICLLDTTHEDKREPSVIGSIRINRIEKKSNCGLLGYELHPDYWKQGFATEALGMVTHYAHIDLSLNRLEAWTIDGNDASNQVLLNNYYQYEGLQREKVLVRDKYENIRLYAHLASDRY